MTNETKLPKNKAQRLQTKLARKVEAIQHDPREDQALITAYNNGDEDAGWVLFENYSDVASIVYKFPSKPPYKTEKMRKLHYQPLSIEDKEDLFQEIAFHFFKLVGEFDPDMKKPFEHMIRAKLHQRVFNNFFSEFIEVETNEVEFDEELDFEAKANSIFLEEGITENLPSEHIELYQAFNQLSKRQREVLEMSIVKGWDSREIAEELGLKSATVRVTLKNGLEKLRGLMIPTEEE
jgi:RNA polymerase sigma factor (sigma-70 family)